MLVIILSVGVMALIAWTAGAVACYIFTSTQTTQGARFPMLMTTFIFALLEYALVSDTMSDGFCCLLRSWRFIHEDGHSVSSSSFAISFVNEI